eukprot:2996672-Pleurochrysis_carterae.AAC.6
MPPSFLFHLAPPVNVSDSILVEIFLCNLIYSMSLPALLLYVYDPFAPVIRRVPCLSDRSMLPMLFYKRAHAFPFLPPSLHGALRTFTHASAMLWHVIMSIGVLLA